jgi:hypothetical protein
MFDRELERPDGYEIRSRRRPVRRLLLWGAAILIAFYVVVRAPLPPIQSWWRAGESNWTDPWHRRHRIADWLVFTHTLVGKTRAQVVEKLAEPPPTDYFRDWSLVYNLGAERGFMSIDSEWLVVRIGGDGRVREARIVRD